MSLSSWARLIERCSYIPESRLEVFPGPRMGYLPGYDQIRLILKVQDTYNPGDPRKQEIAHVGTLPDLGVGDMDESYYLGYLQNFVRGTAVHEADEWFRVDGRIYDDPHKRGR
jgi:hypothetical protein